MQEYTSQRLVYGRAFQKTVIAALKTRPAGALVTTPKLRLTKDPSFNPSPDTTLAALEANEADYSGYTAGGYTPTLSDPVNVGTDRVGSLVHQVFTAATADPFVDNSVTGYWIDDGTNMLLAERFADGAVAGMARVDDYLDLSIVVGLPLTQIVN